MPIRCNLPTVAVKLDHPFAVTVVSVYLPNGKIYNLKNQLAQRTLERLYFPWATSTGTTRRGAEAPPTDGDWTYTKLPKTRT